MELDAKDRLSVPRAPSGASMAGVRSSVQLPPGKQMDMHDLAQSVGQCVPIVGSPPPPPCPSNTNDGA